MSYQLTKTPKFPSNNQLKEKGSGGALVNIWRVEREVVRSNPVGRDMICRLLLAPCNCKLSVLLVVKIYVFCHLRSCELFQLHNMYMYSAVRLQALN